MRTKGLLWVVGVLGPWAVFAGACGDDSPQGGGGSGGETTTVTTGGTTTSSTGSSSSSTSTNSASSSTGLGGGDNDSCPGQNVTITPGSSITLAGSTAGAADDFTTFCGAGASPDVVYSIDLPQACSLSVQGAGSGGFEPIVSLRFSECDMRMQEDLCSNGQAMIKHQPAGTVTLIVDGNDGASGDYSVEVSCGAPMCGDLVVNPGEECDLGQGIPDDTCSDTCTAEGADAADTCAEVDTPIAIPAGETVIPAADPWFTNAGAVDDSQGSCGGAGGKDQVFAFTPAVTGTLSIATALDLAGNPVCVTLMEPECWFSVMYVRQLDCANGVEVGCSSIDPLTGVHQMNNVPVVAGQTYYLFVDGVDDQYYSMGPYTLHFNLQ